jgi:hypothetical protein
MIGAVDLPLWLLRRPPMPCDQATRGAFDNLLDRALEELPSVTA